MRSTLKIVIGLWMSIYAVLNYAAPPYFGVSLGQNVSLTTQRCVQIAENELKEAGFQKLIPSGENVFAAYRYGHNYGYKALVRCMAEQNAIIVVTVAESMKTVRIKADSLRQSIQNHFSSVSNKSSENTCDCSAKQNNSSKISIIGEKQAASNSPSKTVKTWQDTNFDRGQCLLRAETALRNAGFSSRFEIDQETTLSGTNAHDYVGTIRCLIKESVVLFSVTGNNPSNSGRYLEIIQVNF